MKNNEQKRCGNADQKQRLTEHFTLEEMVASGTARRLGIRNVPSAVAVRNMKALCEDVLEPLRRQMGRVIVTSGYRSEALNRAVGGVKNSQHRRGEAADIHCSSLEQAEQWFNFVRDHLDYDQLLLERRLNNGCCWLHISYIRQPGRRQNRRQARFITV